MIQVKFISPVAQIAGQEVLQTVVHDLRSPMAVIKGNLQLLLSGVMGQMTDEQLTLIQRSVDPLEDLILLTDNLLQTAALEKSGMAIKSESTDLDKLLSGVIDFYASSFRVRGMTIYRDGNSFDKKLNIDIAWVKRVLNNLIWNAYKFTPNKGKVAVRVEPCFDGIEIVVEDNGRGIPRNKMNELFEKFNQVSPEYDAKLGTGLGLWICKRIMQLHGGSIRVESEEGQGSRFILHFPTSCLL